MNKKRLCLLLAVLLCAACGTHALAAGNETEIIGQFIPIGGAPAQPGGGSGGSGGNGGGGGSVSGTEPESDNPEETPAEHPSARFTDVDQTKWYVAAIDFVVERGLMDGVGDGQFAPEANLSRAMIVQILYNLEERPAVSGGTTFSDVEDGRWYSAAIRWASANRIVDGYDDGRYQPNADITREQLVTILCRYEKYKGKTAAAAGDTSIFSDAADTSAYARESLSWAVGAGIVNGYDDGTVQPKGTATRAEVAQVMMNYLMK